MSRAALAALALAACAPAPPVIRSGPAPDPIAFFAGHSHGEGRLTQLFKPARTVRVASRGTVGADGALTLVQDISTEGAAARRRTWVMQPAGPGRWRGQLTDADGPVAVVADGGRLRIDYAMPGGLHVRQWLVPIDACTLDNRLGVTKWGLPVAALRETIRRDGAACTGAPPR